MKKILCLLCIGICPLILSFVQPFSANQIEHGGFFCITRKWWYYPRSIAAIVFIISGLILFFTLMSFIFNSCLTMIKKKHFDYNTEHKKFNPKDTVRIFLMHDKKIIKKKVQLTKITNGKLSFKEDNDIHECSSSKIIYIQKPLKKTRYIALVSMVCLLMALSFLIVFKIWDYHYQTLLRQNDDSGFFC